MKLYSVVCILLVGMISLTATASTALQDQKPKAVTEYVQKDMQVVAVSVVADLDGIQSADVLQVPYVGTNTESLTVNVISLAVAVIPDRDVGWRGNRIDNLQIYSCDIPESRNTEISIRADAV